jgi:hypothetical protein
MGTLLEIARGRKTYLIGTALVILAGLHAQGYISDSWYDNMRTLLLGGGFMAARAAIAKVEWK